MGTSTHTTLMHAELPHELEEAITTARQGLYYGPDQGAIFLKLASACDEVTDQQLEERLQDLIKACQTQAALVQAVVGALRSIRNYAKRSDLYKQYVENHVEQIIFALAASGNPEAKAFFEVA